jgi:hypothetical protein
MNPAEKNEIVYTTFSPEVQTDYDFEVTIDIAFGEIPVVFGHPVLGLLNAMAYEVENVLIRIEAECRILFPSVFL